MKDEMTLREWLEQPGENATRLANKCRCAPSTITRAAKGEVIPGRALMVKIMHHTGGKVPPNSFYGVADQAAHTS
ncbi:hypothetical protein LWE61_15095 [Sphingobium sufflavum]|uniref:hypothetical protein n=1 Tax=Sphingobium sufflavum TaxID=1129547 RepID=UPI001F435A75|nr:hypothetical protein [Sphingobium sufflavum]MCE7797875.1 hypothetical protein [Sphingobium sufflavum]